MDLLAKKANINIKYISGYSWDEFLNLIKTDKIDVISNIAPTKQREEFFNFTFDWIDKLISKLKDTGSIYIFNTPYNCAYILQYLVKKGLIFRNWITWDKRDGLGYSKKKYANGQETILFFTKSNNYIFNCDAIRTPYESEERIKHASKKGILKNGKRWYPNPNGRLCGEVWHFSSQRHKEKVKRQK